MTEQSKIEKVLLKRHFLYGKLCTTIVSGDTTGSFVLSHSAHDGTEYAPKRLMYNRLFGTPKNPKMISFLQEKQEYYDEIVRSSDYTAVLRAKACMAFQRRLLLFHGASFLNCKARDFQAINIIAWLSDAFTSVEKFESSPTEMSVAFGRFLEATKCGKALQAA
jgi:hypothetical protein